MLSKTVVIRGQAGMNGLCGLIEHLVLGQREIDRHNVHAGNHDIGHAQVRELHPALHESPLNILQNARLVTLHNEQVQLLDRIHPLAFFRWWEVQHAQDGIAEGVHAPDQGRKHPHGQLHGLGDEERHLFGILQGDGLRD